MNVCVCMCASIADRHCIDFESIHIHVIEFTMAAAPAAANAEHVGGGGVDRQFLLYIHYFVRSF